MLFFALLMISAVVIVTTYIVMNVYSKLKLNLIMRLSYEREFSVIGAFEDEEVYLIETIHNKSFIPVFFIDIEFYLYNALRTDGFEMSSTSVTYIRHSDSAMQTVLSRFHLMPYMKIVRRHRIRCSRRGYYKLDAVGIRYKDLPVYKPSSAELYIYPKLIDIRYNSQPFNISQGNVLSLSKIITDPFLISGVRDYQMGDPFNTINFKATAKTAVANSIKVNKLDYSSARMFMIYINFQKLPDSIISPEMYEKIMEKSLSYTASFINEALKNGYKVGFAANCMMAKGEMKIEFPQVNGLYHIEEILKEIAKVQLRAGISFGALLSNAIYNNVHDSEIFIMTIYNDNSIEEKITLLKKLNNTVNVIELGDDTHDEI